MTTASSKRPKARLEAWIDADLDHMIEEAAQRLHLTKAAFITQMLREASVKVMARADVTLMDPAEFDRMVASLAIPDESPELKKLFSRPTQIAL
jgi:uncharacterized protein (DUF1778 family)